MSSLKKFLFEQIGLYISNIEAIAIIAVLFGIISLSLTSRSQDLQKLKDTGNGPNGPNSSLEMEIANLESAALAFKVFDILLAITVIGINTVIKNDFDQLIKVMNKPTGWFAI